MVPRSVLLVSLITFAACNVLPRQDVKTDKQLLDIYFQTLRREAPRKFAIEDTVPDKYLAALRMIAPVVDRSNLSDDKYEIAPTGAIVRKIDISGDQAKVTMTFGPMYKNANLDCGTTDSIQFTFKSGKWIPGDSIESVVC
ncbi:hypothetical protein [Solilutibacter oculi]|uniref:hypothetical protein n=1 Tax=Solilutibacter oculi TaxID=2698682 RepID=UPI001C2CD2CE|nr:hypothetical protein [Lysobacter oculi]